MTTPTLTTDRLILRRPHAGDWEAFRDFEMSERTKYIGGPRDQAKAWRLFAGMIGHWDIRGYGMWIVTIKGSDNGIGIVGPWHPIDWPEAEIAWVIWTDEHEGTGIATEAAAATITHAWNVLKWNTIVSYIAPENLRSIALAEKLGAAIDPNAPQPDPKSPCLVFRHPKPEALS